jgi:hypothetical protein
MIPLKVVGEDKSYVLTLNNFTMQDPPKAPSDSPAAAAANLGKRQCRLERRYEVLEAAVRTR